MAEEYGDYTDERAGIFDRLASWDGMDIEAYLEQSRAAKKARLEQEFESIKQQLEHRDDIHREIVAELEWKLERYTDRLEKLYTHGVGRLDGKRERLQDKIVTFSRELQEERREHWQDRQQLEQERRDLLREFAETEEDLLSEFL